MAPQVVQITINVTDGNAAEAVQQVVAELNAIGPAGEAAGAQAGAGLDIVREKSMSAREEARLMNEELHLGMSRAMLGVVADTNLLSGAIAAIGPALIGIGAVGIIAGIGKEVYELYEKWFDVDAVTAEYQKKLDEISLKQFLNPENAQMALNNLQQINAQVDELNAKKQQSDATWGGFLGAGERFTPEDEKKRTMLLGQQSQLEDNATRYSNASLENGIAQMEKFVTATEKGYKQIQDLKDLADQKITLQFNEGKFGNLNENFAAAFDRAKDAHTDNQTDATAKRIALQQQETDAIKALQNEATNSGLAGVDLLESKREQAIADFEKKYGASMQAIDAFDQNYMNQERALWDRQEEEGEKNRQTRLQQEDEALKQSLDKHAEYEEKIASILAAGARFETQGYAKIDEEKQRRLDDLAKTNDKEYADNPGAGLQAYSDQALQIEAYTDREREQLHHKTMEQLAKEEEETARLLLPPWQQAMLAIKDQETDRLNQIKQNVKARVMTEDEGATAVVAAWQLAAVQMQKSEEETRDKIASGLQGMFSNPLQFFEKRAMDTAFQLMANEMLSAFKSSGPAGGILQYLFGMGPEMNTSKDPLDAFGSALQMGGHAGMGGIGSPGMAQFQQGSTTVLTASQIMLQAAHTFLSASGSMSMGGTAGGFGMGGGGFDMLGSTSTIGGAGASASSLPGMPAFSTGSGMVGSSPMPETTGDIIPGSFDQSGQFNSAATGTAGLGAAGGIAGGGLMAATSIFSAYQNSNPIAGATGGAMGGMEMGAALGSVIPGLGTAVGGAIGAIAGGLGGLFAGIFGDKGKGQAEGLDVNTVQPQLAKDMQEYESGQAGYSSIASDLTNLLTSSKNSTSQWGSGARNYFNSNIAPEINAALSSLQKQEIGGRSAVTLSAGQYHTGGWTGDFGDLATSETEGFIHAMRDEFVVNPMSAQAHAPLLNAINAGNVTYSQNVQPRMPASSAAGPTLNLSCWDAKSVAQWMKAGGARAIISGINQGQTQYSGTGR